MVSKMRSKITCVLEYRFGRVLGRVLGGFWDTKILDFHNFFDVFWKSFSKRVREGSKIDPRSLQVRKLRFFASGFRSSPPPGERKREGIKSLAHHQELGLSDWPFVTDQGT